MTYLKAVQAVTDDRDPIRKSLLKQHPDIAILFDSSACQRCIAFRDEHSNTAIHAAGDAMQQRCFSAQMLFVLAAHQSNDKYRRAEHLNARLAMYRTSFRLESLSTRFWIAMRGVEA